MLLLFWEGENEMATYYLEKQIEKGRSIDLLTYQQTYEPTELVHISLSIYTFTFEMRYIRTGRLY